MSVKPQPQRAKLDLADEFRLIAGISQAIETRLHSAGILTYEQLAVAQPELLAEILRPLSGATARRIVQQGWNQSALKLAKRLRPKGPALEPFRPELTNEGFVVDLFLDEHRQVQSTQILHVKSDIGESWAGWDTVKLLDFFHQNSQLAQPNQVIPSVALPPNDELSPGLQKIRILSGINGVVRRDEPLTANLTLALSHDFSGSSQPLSYRAEVRARSTEGENIVLALADGELDPAAGSLQVAMAGGRLAPGLYRVRGTLNVTRAGTPGHEPVSSVFSRPGGILQVV